MPPRQSNSDRQFTHRMVQTVLTVAALLVIALIVWTARGALILVYISGLVATSLSPIVRHIERWHLTRRRSAVPRWLAILVIYALFVIGVAVVGLAIIPPLVQQATALWMRLPSEFDNAQKWLIQYHIVPRRVTLLEAVQQAPATDPSTAVNAVLSAGSTLLGGAFGIVTVLILSFYLLVEARSLFSYLMKFVPVTRRPIVSHAANQAVIRVSAWLQGNLILGGVMGAVSGVVLGVIGEPFFYVVALIAALGEVIPMIGPVVAGTVAVSLALTKSTRLALIVGGFFIALHEIEANILVPKIMERRVGVSALAIMLALLIGWEVAGLLGAVLAIPTAAIISVILDEITVEDTPPIG